MAVDVELQQVRGRVVGTSSLFGGGAGKAGFGQVQALDEIVDEAGGVVLTHVIVNVFGQQKRLRAIRAGEVALDLILDRTTPRRNRGQ